MALCENFALSAAEKIKDEYRARICGFACNGELCFELNEWMKELFYFILYEWLNNGENFFESIQFNISIQYNSFQIEWESVFNGRHFEFLWKTLETDFKSSFSQKKLTLANLSFLETDIKSSLQQKLPTTKTNGSHFEFFFSSGGRSWKHFSSQKK